MATLRQTFKKIATSIRNAGVEGTMTPTQMPSKIALIEQPSSKYGVRIGCLFGDVDDNGVLQSPTVEGEFSSSDIVSIGDNGLRETFKNSYGITRVSLPNLTTIGTQGLYGTFSGCSSLASVDLHSLTTIGQYGLNQTFLNCTSLETVDLSSLSTFVGLYACRATFSGCSSLQSIALPSLQNTNVQYALYNTFQDCTSLTTADLSNLNSVGGNRVMYYTFWDCTSLKTVDLSKLSSVYYDDSTSTNIKYGMMGVFNGCTALEVVMFSQATAIPYIDPSNFTDTNDTFKIVVPDALYEDWVVHPCWSARANQIVKVSEYQPNNIEV